MKKKVLVMLHVGLMLFVLNSCGGISEKQITGKSFQYYPNKGVNIPTVITIKSGATTFADMEKYDNDGKGTYELFQDGSSATYLSTKRTGNWELTEDGKVKIMGNGIEGIYDYTGNSLTNSTRTFKLREK